MSFDRPWVLALLLLALLPLLLRPQRASGCDTLALVPADGPSRLSVIALRATGAAAVALLVLALAGPYSGGGTRSAQGLGANIVLLFDRSSSMDNTFADRQPDGDEESKSAVAKRLILEFVDRRPRDRIGIAAFSTAPMLVLPITDHLDAVRGAISAIDLPGLAYTDVGRGLALAFGMFPPQTAGESRALILISDGAGVIGREVQDQLREAVKRNPVNLYWLFIRSKGSYGIHDVPTEPGQDTPQARPERHLHIFLQSLGIPYRALEAQSPRAIAEAIEEIDRLETQPIHYEEAIPRTDLAPLLYRGAAVLLCLLALAALLERPLVPAGTGPLPPVKPRDRAA